MNIQTGLKGEYNLVITKPDGSVTETGWFDNLILNQGLDRIGMAGNVVNCCHIGSGNTTPSDIQTALTTFVASVSRTGSVSVVNAGTPTYASAHTIAYTFPQGAVVGNMAEIGTGWDLSGPSLFSRTLITDASANPVTLTVTAIDQLTVYYKITLVPSTGVVDGTVVLAGTTYNYKSSIAYAGSIYGHPNILVGGDFYSAYNASWSYWVSPASTTSLDSILVPLASEVSYYYGQGVIGVTSAYTTGTYYRDTTYTLPIALGNLAGGIGGIRPMLGSDGGEGRVKYVFTPAIPKDATKTLSMTFRTSWARA